MSLFTQLFAKLPKIDVLGRLLGAARRRQLEAQAKAAAQSYLDANKATLVTLAFQVIDALPITTTAEQIPQLTEDLLQQVLTSKTVQGLPALAQDALSAALPLALSNIQPVTDAAGNALAGYQAQARAALETAIRGLKL